ncbi:MAG: hypothetical protein J0M24_12715 [Verrucomicrobia bacterium]|nr:hypothetical protein [Verrucomicrobiota bacterium]
MLNVSTLVFGLVVATSLSSAAQASVGWILGTGAPPIQVGPLKLTPFDPDPTPEFDFVNSVASPLGGDVGFSEGLEHVIVPFSWGSWSHDYEGDAYALGPQSFSVTLTLPAGTGAFVFYAEPATLQLEGFAIIETSSLAPILVDIDGNGGATGFAFLTTSSGGLGEITISASAPFAIGEFLIAAVPETSSGSAVALMAAGAGLLAWRRRRVA